jgi:beta-glucosidase
MNSFRLVVRRPTAYQFLLLPLAAFAWLGVAFHSAWSETDRDHMKDAITPMPRRDNSYVSRHKAFISRATQGKIDLLFVGDSIVAGWATQGKEVWEREYAPRNAANMGIPGDKTQFMLWRLADGEMQGYTPHVVVLMAGTNNLKSGDTRMPPDAVAAGVGEIVKLFRKQWPQTHVLLLGILPRQPEYDWIAEAIRDTNTKLKALAEADDHVTFLDFGNRFLDENGKVREDLMPDRLHPNTAGYEIWVKAMRDTLNQLMAESR